jgi:GNAT superfamily N-acetyltransferase
VIAIREATAADAAALAELTTQLGYPSTKDDIADRLPRVKDDGTAIFVAELDDTVVAWIGVREDFCLEFGGYAEIVGLVVHESARGQRVGEQLVSRAEAWAVGRGQKRLRVRSNVVRERAHRFYERLGFAVIKKQAVFDKAI